MLVDGSLAAVVDVRDRGLQYGEGVFRTVRVIDGRPKWWQAQLDKLAADCQRLSIPCADASVWQADWAALGPVKGQGVLKLLVTRGSGPRGYRPPAGNPSRRILMFHPQPANAPGQDPAVRARLCALRLGHQPLLAGIKHLGRLEHVLARAEWDDPAIAEGLLLDLDGRVVSGVMSNLLVWRGTRLSTPRLHRCGVAGVTRDLVWRQARADNIEMVEHDMTLRDVLDADEVMLCNSLMGVVRVARLDQRVWTRPVISPRLVALLEKVEADA